MTLFLLLSTGVGLAAEISAPVDRTGMSDASAAVAVGTNLFAVADNEQTAVFVYHRDRGGAPVKVFNFAGFLELDRRHPQVDVEGAACIGERAYWISSHGRDARARFSPNRQRLFATAIKLTGNEVELLPVGKPYKDLLSDLLSAPQLEPYRLQAASARAPKEHGGLNIEGLCATPSGQLLIGFRSPIPEDRALVVPLTNPDEVIHGQKARLGQPLLLDLDGLGIRDLAYADNKYVIIGGPDDGKGKFRLYWWLGPENQPVHIQGCKFSGLHPEAIVVYPDKGLREFQILSDDGTQLVDGRPNKEQPAPQRTFRSVWVTPGSAP